MYFFYWKINYYKPFENIYYLKNFAKLIKAQYRGKHNKKRNENGQCAHGYSNKLLWEQEMEKSSFLVL